MNNNYLSVVYDSKSHPYNNYPLKLCAYLYQIFKFKKGMKMLEVGCGRGEFLENFHKLGLNVFGLDISPEAKSFKEEFNIKICDVENERLPFDDNTFDIVYSKSFIEHLYYPERYLREAHRVLKPNGLLLTLVPDWESNYKIYFDDFTHRTPFTFISLKDAYLMHDFKRVNVFKFRQLPIVWKYPFLNSFCRLISPLVPIRSKNKFMRWSKELMLIGVGYK